MAAAFGQMIRLELYGESHGPCIGVRVDGLPAGLPVDLEKLQRFLERRAPGRNEWSTSRKEPDKPEFISGLAPAEEGSRIRQTDGSRLEAVIRNTNIRPQDYRKTNTIPRPGHADYPAWVKYGEIPSGGGVFSARLTAALCIAGGMFMQWLEDRGVTIRAHIASVGEIEDAPLFEDAAQKEPAFVNESFPVVDEKQGEKMKELIARTKENGDSVGGVIECAVTGIPAGAGSPLFGSIESRLCEALFAVPAVKGVEFGAGFKASAWTGSRNNDPFEISGGQVRTVTNHHGGILGGLASGMPIVFRAAMKPTPSIALEQKSVDLMTMKSAALKISGRHDPCIVPRAVPCIESAAAAAAVDILLGEGLLTAESNELVLCRQEIDRIDAELIRLLQARMDVSERVIRYKERRGLPVLDAVREKEKRDALGALCEEEKRTYMKAVLQNVMDQSKLYQEDRRLRYGLLGKKLGHSHSPRIHRLLGGYEYGLFERTEDQLEDFFREGFFQGINVTIPYKKTVIKYCAEISDRAKACGSVNTIVRRADGSLYGDNTDYAGFRALAENSGIPVRGKKALVLGSGGASGTAACVLRDMGAGSVVIISRTGEDNYGNLERHKDAEIIVNTTPVGMMPDMGKTPVDIKAFPSLKAVFDLIFNPMRTKLMLDAEAAGVPAFGGLEMLVEQAAEASELFTGNPVPKEKTRSVYQSLRDELRNIVLIGMPGAGKTTVGRALAAVMKRRFLDLDDQLEKDNGRSCEEIIETDGIDAFRRLETETIRKSLRGDADNPPAAKAGEGGGWVIACGGGCVERPENRDMLLENAEVVFIDRDISELSDEGRPVSRNDGPEAIYARRKEAYLSWSDIVIHAAGSAEDTAARIAEALSGKEDAE